MVFIKWLLEFFLAVSNKRWNTDNRGLLCQHSSASAHTALKSRDFLVSMPVKACAERLEKIVAQRSVRRSGRAGVAARTIQTTGQMTRTRPIANGQCGQLRPLVFLLHYPPSTENIAWISANFVYTTGMADQKKWGTLLADVHQ
ncbi:hypothetical protein EVAR_80807_1 [Eumeta japonica]|uniref:Mariner Mos1 transposase n=1 Tax=Eumeta variegata TaxID=151549 RepID=A0A4C1WFG9_EUMVA|nr:hypothetical protein EVAR_80807_1 [Eumeta japonica]